MGSKKKKKTHVTTTDVTETSIVKLTYVETLAVSQNLTSAESLTETEGFEESSNTSSTKRKGAYAGFGDNVKSGKGAFAIHNAVGSVLGKGKKKSVKVKSELSSTGIQVKDQFMQPYFDRIRYGIGIKELSVSRFKFEPNSEFISVPYLSPKEIIKVNIAIDEYIPPSFDQSQTWIEYYIKAEGESEWLRINPLDAPTKHESAGNIIPKIINFNLPKPTTAKLEDKYNYTEQPIHKLRFRALITRPEGGNNDSITPMLKSYRLVMIPRA
jgi:hypothetical protein